MREYKGKTKVRVGVCGSRCEEMDGHRRTSRTICHRLVTPLLTPSMKKRGVLWRQFRKRRVESCKLSVVVLQTRTKVVGRVPRDKSIAGGLQHPATRDRRIGKAHEDS